LDGLGAAAREILKEKGLAEEEKWEDLINLYRGNPLWLNLVARLSKDLLGGRVYDLIKYETLVLNQDLKDILHQQFNRLSELEKQVISVIANVDDLVSISKLLSTVQLSPSEVFNAMQSLGRRSLIEKIEGSETLFTLEPVVREYVKIEIRH
jgi:hypothetical protein